MRNAILEQPTLGAVTGSCPSGAGGDQQQWAEGRIAHCTLTLLESLSPPQNYWAILKKNREKWSIQKLCIKKVINANSTEKIAPTDGTNPFPANASGCADGNYRMYVNTQALGSAATHTAELGRCRGCHSAHPRAIWLRRKLDFQTFPATSTQLVLCQSLEATAPILGPCAMDLINPSEVLSPQPCPHSG